MKMCMFLCFLVNFNMKAQEHACFTVNHVKSMLISLVLH